MKKILLLFIASSSISLVAMGDAPTPLCGGNQNSYDCCSSSLPYATHNHFYNPDTPLPELPYVPYLPQMIADEINPSNILPVSLEQQHIPIPPYNPAVRLILSIRSALSSTVTPVQPPAASANHNE